MSTQPTRPDDRPGICIVAHFALGALRGGRYGHVGGVEWQTSLTARWFANRGYRVSLLTWDEGQEDDLEIDGVRVIKICRRDAGLPGVRFFHPRWSGLTRAMQMADADVYYQNCGEYVTGQVALWCSRRHRPFVYSVASNPDCDPRLPAMRTRRERVLYRYGLQRADDVIVQTREQQRMLADGFDRLSRVIPMPCPGPCDEQYVQRSGPVAGAARVAWVGRIVPLKRLEWLLDIAERLPDVSFDVIGAPEADDAYIRGLQQRAAARPNVTLHGRVPRDQMPAAYQKADCLLCTSSYEGFPNTFLEAFSHGVPVVSTVDPDGVIAAGGLGGVAADIDGLTATLRGLLSNPTEWQRSSANARHYWKRNHTLEAVLPQFERVFLDAIALHGRECER